MHSRNAGAKRCIALWHVGERRERLRTPLIGLRRRKSKMGIEKGYVSRDSV